MWRWRGLFMIVATLSSSSSSKATGEDCIGERKGAGAREGRRAGAYVRTVCDRRWRASLGVPGGGGTRLHQGRRRDGTAPACLKRRRGRGCCGAAGGGRQNPTPAPNPAFVPRAERAAGAETTTTTTPGHLGWACLAGGWRCCGRRSRGGFGSASGRG